MFAHQITKLRNQALRRIPIVVFTTHTETCPTKPKQKSPGCSGNGVGLKRVVTPGKVRMGILPDEWFLFFHSHTGVSGPYIFGIMLANYLFSKEIYVMEHEYYCGLSIFVIVYYATKTFGPLGAKALDKEVDEVTASLEKGRKDELDYFTDIINSAKDSQWRAEGQKLLVDAKKENVAMQLEAAYRDRCMQVYRMIKSRLDYQVKIKEMQNRIQQKWMIEWILENVKKSITPELENQVLEQAILELGAISSRSKSGVK